MTGTVPNVSDILLVILVIDSIGAKFRFELTARVALVEGDGDR